MAITYTWFISSLEAAKQEENLSNVVKTLHWRYKATDEDGYFAESYGAQSLDTPDQTTFVSYENLTFEIVVGWLEELLDITGLQQMLQNNIEDQKNPPTVTMRPPWETVVEEPAQEII
jgi:hypothetical protein